MSWTKLGMVAAICKSCNVLELLLLQVASGGVGDGTVACCAAQDEAAMDSDESPACQNSAAQAVLVGLGLPSTLAS